MEARTSRGTRWLVRPPRNRGCLLGPSSTFSGWNEGLKLMTVEETGITSSLTWC
jgi:hypothetical protein